MTPGRNAGNFVILPLRSAADNVLKLLVITALVQLDRQNLRRWATAVAAAARIVIVVVGW